MIFQTTGVEVGIVIEQLHDIGPLTAFNRCRGPGRKIVGIDMFQGDLDPGLLYRIGRLLVSDYIGSRNEACPFEDVQCPGLGQGGCLPSHKLRTGCCRQRHTC